MSFPTSETAITDTTTGIPPNTGFPAVLSVIALSILAFLLACTPIRSGHIWTVLTNGKAASTAFGLESGGPTAPHLAPGWLGDFIFYQCRRAFGENSLTILKSLLLVCLPLLLLSKQKTTVWRPFLGCFLTLLALGTQFQFDTIIFSFLAWAYLYKKYFSNVGSEIPTWQIGLLFIVWVNLDRWFFIGIVGMALYAVGQIIQTRSLRRPTAGWTSLLVAIAACTVNPQHLKVFDIRTTLQLAELNRLQNADPLYRELFSTPGLGQFWQGQLSWSVGELSYLLIVVIGFLSFLAAGRSSPWSRLTLWVGMLAISLGFPQTVPFFIIVAGSILAANFDENDGTGFKKTKTVAPQRSRFRRYGANALRASFFVLLFSILELMAWIGWLQPAPYERRGWDVQTDPSIREVAQQLGSWQKNGTIEPGEVVFCLNPEVADAIGWFSPQIATFPQAATQTSTLEQTKNYLEIRRQLTQYEEPKSQEDWETILQKYNARWVVLHETSAVRFGPAFAQLLSRSNHWQLVYERGRVVIFLKRDTDPDSRNRLQTLAIDLRQRAYQPSAGDEAPRNQDILQYAPPPHWYDAITQTRPPRSIHRDEAALYLLQYDMYRPVEAFDNMTRLLTSQSATVVASAGMGLQGGMMSDNLFRIQLLKTLLQDPPASQNPVTNERIALQVASRLTSRIQADGPLPELLLAVRAGRRAIAENRQNPAAYLILGDSYMRILSTAREAEWESRLPLLSRIRKVQAVTAYRQAIILDPDLVSAQINLARLFQELGYIDLTLQHYQNAEKILRKQGKQPNETADGYRDKMSALTATIDKIKADVEDRERIYEANIPNLKLLDKARQAGRRGLIGKALQLLMESDLTAFGASGLYMEMDLLLTTGRVSEVHDWFRPELRSELGNQKYYTLRMQLLAAIGDYEGAMEACQNIVEDARNDETERQEELEKEMAIWFSRMVLDGGSEGTTIIDQVMIEMNRDNAFKQISQTTRKIQQRADRNTLQGILALESGQIRVAKDAFADALQIWDNGKEHGIDFTSRKTAEACQRLLVPDK